MSSGLKTLYNTKDTKAKPVKVHAIDSPAWLNNGWSETPPSEGKPVEQAKTQPPLTRDEVIAELELFEKANPEIPLEYRKNQSGADLQAILDEAKGKLAD